MLRLESSSEVLVEEVLQEEEVNYLASRLVTKVVSDALCRHQSDNCKVGILQEFHRYLSISFISSALVGEQKNGTVTNLM